MFLYSDWMWPVILAAQVVLAVLPLAWAGFASVSWLRCRRTRSSLPSLKAVAGEA